MNCSIGKSGVIVLCKLLISCLAAGFVLIAERKEKKQED